MSSCEDHVRAVKLYIKLDKRTQVTKSCIMQLLVQLHELLHGALFLR